MNSKMTSKTMSQKNTNHRCKCDDNDYMHNMLINRYLSDTKSDQEISAVNKMLLVLIFLMVK